MYRVIVLDEHKDILLQKYYNSKFMARKWFPVYRTRYPSPFVTRLQGINETDWKDISYEQDKRRSKKYCRG